MHRLGLIGSKASALALLFILSQERGSSVAALSRPSLKEATYDHDFHEKRCNNPDQCVHG